MIVFFPPLWEHPCAHIHCPLCQKYKILSEVHTKLSKEFSTWTVLPTAMICLSEGELMIVFFPPLWEHPCAYIHCPLCQKDKILSEKRWYICNKVDRTVGPTASQRMNWWLFSVPPLWEHLRAHIHCHRSHWIALTLPFRNIHHLGEHALVFFSFQKYRYQQVS